ncbi:hypothetical protein [Streptomyces afghaniensis]|uniref:hypothetical protein n=1 Tax=Streptomyces afghaniensis TaxID=66865 RepID=UPI0027817803|nr:hypothetical protein [Streptomyces afghaniensis]MDQ1016947.1 hypothetical protein [Streptomyces afghaniensis]
MSASVRLARAWRALGEHRAAERALEVAEGLARSRPTTVGMVVRAMVEAAWYDRAEHLVAELDGTEADTLVEELVAAGRHDQAARVAGLDEEPDRVSPRAAAALAPVVAPPLGRTLAVRLLVTEGWWLAALPAVARLEPGAVPWVVEALPGTAGPAGAAPPAPGPAAGSPTAARTSAPS